LSDESFLAIGSVAYGFIPPNSIAAGNPAVRIKDRFRTARSATKENSP
jgi:acetyltransferase-like isoleucine patch superfamily enzyme